MNGECRMKIQIFNRLIRHGESFRAPRSVQESIPVRKIYRDGVWLCGGRYSKMWRFQDVNYAVASEADQSEILISHVPVPLSKLVLSRFAIRVSRQQRFDSSHTCSAAI